MRLFLLLALTACAPRTAPPVDAAAAAPAATEAPPAGLNDRFIAPDLDVAEWSSRFERPEREVYGYRQPIVDALGLAPSQAVADIGAGTGAYLDPLAAAVGTDGAVYAVELSPVFVAHLNERVAATGLAHVHVVQSTPTATNLPDASVDLAILVDVYHHLDDPGALLADLARAMRPGGRLALVEFHRIEGVSSPWILGHVKLSREEALAEIGGFGWSNPTAIPIAGLVDNYVVTFDAP